MYAAALSTFSTIAAAVANNIHHSNYVTFTHSQKHPHSSILNTIMAVVEAINDTPQYTAAAACPFIRITYSCDGMYCLTCIKC